MARRSAMMMKSFATAVMTALTLAAGCSKSQDRAPELQTQAPVQSINRPKTVSGCLRAGVGENTFVLHTSKTDGSTSSATYDLKPGPGVDLHSHTGQDVVVSGVLETEQTVATSGESQQKPAKDGVGTPTVDTRTELDIRTFDVASIKSTGSRCSD